jgi:hypothetical protein
VRKDEEQRRRVFAVYDGKRPDSANSRSIHRGDCHVADEGAECTLLRTGEQVVAPQLDVLAGRGLAECVEPGQRRRGGNDGRREKFTSVHEYLVEDR